MWTFNYVNKSFTPLEKHCEGLKQSMLDILKENKKASLAGAELESSEK